MKPSTAAVLRMLRTRGWVCGSAFLAARHARYSARLHELRDMGHRIERRRCQDPDHAHEAPMWEWAILSPADTAAHKYGITGEAHSQELRVQASDAPGTRPHQLTLTAEMT